MNKNMRKMYTEQQIAEITNKILKKIYVLEINALIVSIGGHPSTNELTGSFILNEIPTVEKPFQINYGWLVEGQYEYNEVYLAVDDNDIVIVGDTVQFNSAEIVIKDLLGNIIVSVSI